MLPTNDNCSNLAGKKLYRGISRATENENLVSRARLELAMDFHTNFLKPPENVQHVDTPDYTFTLPDLTIYSDDYRKFLEKDLIECSTLNSLETAQRLNWWAESGFCRKLWPLATTGDGNCLLHAASLAMWGFHDRKLTLRAALHSVLSAGEYKDALWRRWRFQQTRLNKQAGFVYSSIEWAKEWEEIVCMASPEPRCAKNSSRRRSIAVQDSIDDNATYESLEEIHIFALSHVLRRTIIVVADTVLRDIDGEAMAPIPFGGVYLPFEIPANECHRAPLLLTYDMAHFSALVAMEGCSEQPPALIPLTDVENVLLPIQFCIDPGKDFDWTNYDGSEGNWTLTDREHVALLKEYLDIVYAGPLGSPEEEILVDLVDEDFEKRIAEGELTFGDEAINGNGKSKAAKQLQSVAKQFGSIGKSMSKKIKKNIGSIAKIGGGYNNVTNGTNGKAGKKGTLPSRPSTQSFTRQRVLCAQLKAKRHDYQEEMIKNYLECAHDRFMDTEKAKELRELEQQQLDLLKLNAATPERETNCINAGCTNYGTSATSYMCKECFEKQKERELNSNIVSDVARYGTGNSKFYTQSDSQSHKTIKRIPSVRRLNELDQTLYLSNSTFYNDRKATASPVTTVATATTTTSSSASARSTSTSPNSPSNGSSFGHGYSPTETASQSRTVIIPITVEGRHEPSDIADGARFTSGKVLPAGGAAIFSPGNTITHHTRQTVHLPPIQHNILGIAAAAADDDPLSKRITYSDIVSGTLKQDNGLPTYKSAMRDTDEPYSSRIATPFLQSQGQPCRTRDCKFYGSVSTNYYCSKCCLNNAQAKTQSKILTDV